MTWAELPGHGPVTTGESDSCLGAGVPRRVTSPTRSRGPDAGRRRPSVRSRRLGAEPVDRGPCAVDPSSTRPSPGGGTVNGRELWASVEEGVVTSVT